MLRTSCPRLYAPRSRFLDDINYFCKITKSLFFSFFHVLQIHNGSIPCLHIAFPPVFRILHKNGFEPIRKTRFFPSKKPDYA